MGDDAKALCPDIHLFRVAEVRGKADLTKLVFWPEPSPRLCKDLSYLK